MSQQPDVLLDGLYGDLVMEHYRNPHNRGVLDGADLEAEEFTPFCGDRAVWQIKLDGEGFVSDVKATAEGCSIIQASTSIISDLLNGKSLDDAMELGAKFREVMRKDSGYQDVDLGDLIALQVVRQYPVRIKCALLPLTALEEGIKAYMQKMAN